MHDENHGRWIQQALRSLVGAPCILCQEASTLSGVFAPDDSQRYGAPVGKQRYLAYALCAACFALPGGSVAIEQALLGLARSAQAQLN